MFFSTKNVFIFSYIYYENFDKNAKKNKAILYILYETLDIVRMQQFYGIVYKLLTKKIIIFNFLYVLRKI